MKRTARFEQPCMGCPLLQQLRVLDHESWITSPGSRVLDQLRYPGSLEIGADDIDRIGGTSGLLGVLLMRGIHHVMAGYGLREAVPSARSQQPLTDATSIGTSAQLNSDSNARSTASICPLMRRTRPTSLHLLLMV